MSSEAGGPGTREAGPEAGARGAAGEEFVDVAVVGAGLSGIGAAYRLQRSCPGLTFTVLEQRPRIGGTWDLFRYPGVRSDSDMYTLGYSFRPWRQGRALADGAAILDYIRGTAAEHGLEDAVRTGTKVVAADFDSRKLRWRLALEVTNDVGQVSARTLWCRFLYSCAGYYDYEHPHDAQLPGLDRFAGTVLHPQFWPERVDYADKSVVVIGSGATAVTLVPAMAAAAGSVTMLQRSPTWIGSVPQVDAFAETAKRLLPARIAHRAARARNIAFSTAFYQFCRRLPGVARRVLLQRSRRELGDADAVRDHFTPAYDPWDQRFCAVPDGDLFRAVRSGRARVVTDTIAGFDPDGVRLVSGRVLPADVVVTATGLQLRAFGGIEPSVDGQRVDLSGEFVWQGAMVSGLPNFAVCIGYTNASWTLRADLSHRLVCRVLLHMRADDVAAVVPAPPAGLRPRPLLELAAGYIRRSVDEFPRQGDRGPWKVRQNYLLDSVAVGRAKIRRDLRGSGRWSGQVRTDMPSCQAGTDMPSGQAGTDMPSGQAGTDMPGGPGAGSLGDDSSSVAASFAGAAARSAEGAGGARGQRMPGQTQEDR